MRTLLICSPSQQNLTGKHIVLFDNNPLFAYYGDTILINRQEQIWQTNLLHYN